MSNFFGRVHFNVDNAVGAAGISEIYPMVQDSYTSAINELKSIVTKRLAMMVADVHVAYACVSDSDIIGDSAPVTDVIDSAGTFATTDDDITVAFDVVLTHKFTDDAYTKRSIRKIGFLPDSQFNSENLLLNLTDPWKDALTTWATEVLSGCCIATRLPDAVDPPFWTFTALAHRFDGHQSNRKVGRPFGLPVGRRVIR